VKMDNPKGKYFGGATAAPVSRVILEAAIAARDAALDWESLATSRRVTLVDAMPTAWSPRVTDTAAVDSVLASGPTVVTLGSKALTPTQTVARSIPVPDVRGWPLRAAVRALHRTGLQVEVVSAPLGWTTPVPGTVVKTRSVVRIGDGS
jgi:hypothetical protein